MGVPVLQPDKPYNNCQPAHIAILDRNGEIISVNEAWKQFATENGAEPLISTVDVGTNYLAVCRNAIARTSDAHDPAIDGARRALEGIQAVLDGSVSHFTLEYSCDSPTDRRWFLMSVTQLHEGAGTAVVSHQDITERKRSERALRESEERFHLIARVTNDAVWDWDLLTNDLWWNEGFMAMFGYTAEDIEPGIGSWVERLHADDRWRVINSVRQVIDSGGQFWKDEYRYLRSNGEYAYIHDRGYVVRDDAGNPIRMLGAMIDITERKLAEEERETLLRREQQARQRAEDASRLKDDFLATVSHELRTPLTAIKGWANILLKHDIDEDTTARALAVIERNANAQTQIIDDLLDISRIITGRLRIEARPVNLSLIIRRATDSARPVADAKGIQLNVNSDSGATPVVNGDPDRLQQIVWNLLSNAIRFTPAGGRVQVSLERLDSEARIIVSDTGKGIIASFLPYVFDRFRQEDSSSTRVYGGLGLGLSIVRQLTELHGGAVEAVSAGEGHGATFTVRLPLLHRQSVANGDGMLAPSYDSESEEAESIPSLEGMRVLVVDDDEDSRDFIVTALRHFGVDVDSAGSAAEALRTLRENEPDVIFCDISMPGEDGYSLIRKIRGTAQRRDIPAVALTAYAHEEDRIRALRAGFQLHVPKPVNATELALVVASFRRENAETYTAGGSD